MATKSTKILRAVLLACVFALVLTAVGIISAPGVAYADSANPFLQVTCGSANKSGTGWTWVTDVSNNGTPFEKTVSLCSTKRRFRVL